MADYYETKDLADFPNINEWSTETGNKFFDYYNSAVSAGRLSDREKSLIALAVAMAENCPYCIDAYTNKCMSLGISEEEMMEAVHTGSAIMAGITLAHSTQMRKIIKKKKM